LAITYNMYILDHYFFTFDCEMPNISDRPNILVLSLDDKSNHHRNDLHFTKF